MLSGLSSSLSHLPLWTSTLSALIRREEKKKKEEEEEEERVRVDLSRISGCEARIVLTLS